MPQPAPTLPPAPLGPELVTLNRDQVDTLVEWAAAEGWDPGVRDAEIFADTFPGAFVGYVRGGELLAGGSIASYSGEYGFMGFFIVRPDLRNAGLGRTLWFQRRDTLRQRLQPGASIGMDGVVAMQDFYRRGGFEIAYRDERRVRPGTSYPPDPAVAALVPADFEDVVAYDRQCFGFDRRDFLHSWLFNPEARAFVHRSGATLGGFAVVRRTLAGAKVGPLFADDGAAARALYRACLTAYAGRPVALDIPMTNPAAIALADEHGASTVFECARMYLGEPPAHRLDRVFGITTFEFG